MKNKKSKSKKIYYQPKKEKLQKKIVGVFRNLPEGKKIFKKEYVKTYY